MKQLKFKVILKRTEKNCVNRHLVQYFGSMTSKNDALNLWNRPISKCCDKLILFLDNFEKKDLFLLEAFSSL